MSQDTSLVQPSDLGKTSVAVDQDMMQQLLTAAKKTLRKQVVDEMKKLTKETIDSQSAAAARRVIDLPEYKSAKGVCLYLSMPFEVQTRAVLEHALANDKICFVPRVVNKEDMVMLRVYNMEDVNSLEKSKWGIPEPDYTVPAVIVDPTNSTQGDSGSSSSTTSGSDSSTSTPAASYRRSEARDCSPPTSSKSSSASASPAADGNSLGMVLAPAVAFDLQANRLGHGRGYYDRYLKSLIKARATAGLPPVVVVGYGLDCQLVLPEGEPVEDEGAEEQQRGLEGHGNDNGKGEKAVNVSDAASKEDGPIRGVVPVGPSDVPLDIVVLPSRVIRRQSPTSSTPSK